MSPGSSHARHLAEAGRLANEIRLSVEQVSYAYSANPTQAPLFTLEATSFQARPGEIVAILGPNASGKSTLLQLIAGVLSPLSGRVLLDGFVIHSLSPRTRAQRIAMVQQESRLLCRPDPSDAPRPLLARWPSGRHLSARIARTGFPGSPESGDARPRAAACDDFVRLLVTCCFSRLPQPCGSFRGLHSPQTSCSGRRFVGSGFCRSRSETIRRRRATVRRKPLTSPRPGQGSHLRMSSVLARQPGKGCT